MSFAPTPAAAAHSSTLFSDTNSFNSWKAVLTVTSPTVAVASRSPTTAFLSSYAFTGASAPPMLTTKGSSAKIVLPSFVT